METWRFGFLHPCYNKGNLNKMYIFYLFSVVIRAVLYTAPRLEYRHLGK